jgi:hypothetical protein
VKIFESVAWLASGFVPTLALLEIYEKYQREEE